MIFWRGGVTGVWARNGTRNFLIDSYNSCVKSVYLDVAARFYLFKYVCDFLPNCISVCKQTGSVITFGCLCVCVGLLRVVFCVLYKFCQLNILFVLQ